jgi:hypothetical protein
MAGKQTDTFPYDLNGIELNEAELEKVFNVATKRPEVVERFDTPIRLTSEENEPVLWAVGRSQSAELMVESRYDDETYPARPFGSFVTHAEELAFLAFFFAHVSHTLFWVLYIPITAVLPKPNLRTAFF